MKTCFRCKTPQSPTEFRAHSRNLSGLRGVCRTCQKASDAAYRTANYSRVKARALLWSRKNSHLNRGRSLWRRYGMTEADYTAMKARQEGRCKCCGKLQERVMDVDHCHRTGQVRALLCHSCNVAFGVVRESRAVLEQLRSYLDFCESLVKQPTQRNQ